MFRTILDAIQGTPWWVWVLFAYLLFIGIKALNHSITPIRNILVMPTVFLMLSLQGLLKDLTLSNAVIWLLALPVGIMLGLFLCKKLLIKADKMHRLIALPGTKVTLIVVLSIFAVKYYFGYQRAMHPELVNYFVFNFTRLALFAVITGLSLGKAASLVHKYQKAPHTDLKQ